MHVLILQGQLDLSVKHSATLQLLHEDCSFTYPSLSTARYSFVRLNELEQLGVDEIAHVSKGQHEDSGADSLD